MAGVHIKAVYTRTRASGAEDVAITTHDLAFAGANDRPNNAQMDAMAAPYITFWNAIKTVASVGISSRCTLTELRFYTGYDGDGSPGQVDYVKTYPLPGSDSSAGMLPAQVACTVTELTDSRRHWGRFYLPGLSYNGLDVDGTLKSAMVTAMANAAETLYKAWGALTDVTPIVWTRSSHPIEYLGVAPPRWRPSWIYPAGTTYSAPAALAVQSIRVDEILDIQRRRRFESTMNRQTRQLA